MLPIIRYLKWVKVIEKVTVPADEKEREEKFQFIKNPSDVKLLLEFMLDVLLATPT